LAYPSLADISRRHPLHKASRFWPGDLHLPLTRNVPDLNMLAQVPVVLFNGLLKRLWQQHVVDDGKAPYAVLLDAIGVRCASYAARHVQT
jgi:hypothetical protein